MGLNFSITREELGHLKVLIENALATSVCIEDHKKLAPIKRKVLFEMSKIGCPYCESHNAEEVTVRRCLECGNEFYLQER